MEKNSETLDNQGIRQTADKLVLPQAGINKRRKKQYRNKTPENGKGFIEKPLPLLAFPDFERCSTFVQQRTQNRKI